MQNYPERWIVALWQRLARRGAALTTVSGQSLRIVYPGRVNHGRGADFCDAVITTGHGTVTGDIEIHRRSSDWQAHGHHEDPHYNRVVLHVAMRQDGSAGASRQGGGDVPLLVLDRYLATNGRKVSPMCRSSSVMRCTGKRPLAPQALGRLLDQAGDERFRAKAGRFGGAAGAQPGQSLYSALLGALGYSQNRLPFLELARRMPLEVLESLRVCRPDEEYRQAVLAVLLGTAGLLPSQRGLPDMAEPEAGGLEELWRRFPPAQVMSLAAWDLFRVRPNNSPVRRLVALSHLLVRNRDTGLAGGLIDLLRAAPPDGVCRRLDTGLVVTVDGYWARHCDFGRTCIGVGPSVLGRSRAADIVVNVLLPFTFAWSRVAGEPALEEKCLETYRGYPRLAGNSIEEHMRRQLRTGSLVGSARRQQGLRHIYETLCTQGKCDSCPVVAARSA